MTVITRSRVCFWMLLAFASPVSLMGLAPGSAAAAAPVSVFPVPGSLVVSPSAQIAFRGVPAGQLGAITVTGSRSGVHTGTVAADSDGQGGSFLPATPFIPGEQVTVTTNLSVVGSQTGSFQYTIATPGPAIPYVPIANAPRSRGDVSRFRSRPDLAPAAVTVTKNAGASAAGDVFLGPQQGPLQKGPMIVDPSGRLVWFKPLPRRDLATDVRVQSYQGKPVLTWWQGYLVTGIGEGEDVISDSSYRQIAVVRAANGLNADLHEFRITPRGTALITGYYPVYWDASSVHGPKRAVVLDAAVQEIDIATGLVLYQWDSLDHVPLTASYVPAPTDGKSDFDYFHINSIEPDRDGDLVISARNTWAAYKISHRTGQTVWSLGGKHSSFKMGPLASFAFAHDVRVRANNDMYLTLFDDGAGPPDVHHFSRGLKLRLDLTKMTATRVTGLDHSPQLLSHFEGNYQQLAGGDSFLGWGEQSYFTEFSPRGKIVYDAHFVGVNSSYRAYRFPWVGLPATAPAASVAAGKHETVYASWNGATQVASWRVLGGAAPNSLGVVASASKSDFETSIKIRTEPYVAVQALDSGGHVLGVSATVRAR